MARDRRSVMSSRTVRMGVMVGLVAGIVMALWSMIVGALVGMPFLALPRIIAEPFFGPYTPASIGVAAVIVGLVVHLILSAFFGLVFATVWPMFNVRGPASLVEGLLFMLII